MGASSNKKKAISPSINYFETEPQRKIIISEIDSKCSSDSKEKNNNHIIINDNLNINPETVTNNLATINVNNIEDDIYSTKSHTKSKNSDCFSPKKISRNLTQPKTIEITKNEEIYNNIIYEN